ncbi:MAG: FG-GAP-like repeat-containing protein [Planctomycetota bacterium]
MGVPQADSCPSENGDPDLLFKAYPVRIQVAAVGNEVDSATISDVEIADFDGDHRKDIAVAWYCTDCEDISTRQRFLSLYLNSGTGFWLAREFDLYIHNPIDNKSIFRNGTADIGLGDYDGDGDVDLAVAAFFGDELWIFENLGAGEFTAHLKYPFDFNTAGNLITPPELLSGDFDGDGRDELVYLVDPIQYYDGQLVHFWKTSSTIEQMQRVWWEGKPDATVVQWTRALAVADFDNDGQTDLCFTGSIIPPQEDNPILTFWYDFDAAAQLFEVRYEYPDILCSDVVDVCQSSEAAPGLLLTDLNGSLVQYWERVSSTGQFDFVFVQEESGYAGISPNRGVSAVCRDIDGDGDQDLITKQKLGQTFHANQIELTVFDSRENRWTRVDPTPLNTSYLANDLNNQILRPRNLAVADLCGNALPEIVGGFGPSSDPTLGGFRALELAIWHNSCLGDVNRDGRTNEDDLQSLQVAFGSCTGQAFFNPDADLDKNGCVDDNDRLILLNDMWCRCDIPDCIGQLPADSNCDGQLNAYDVDAFTVALGHGEAAWRELYGGSGCQYLCVNDVNGDGVANSGDIDYFIRALAGLD